MYDVVHDTTPEMYWFTFCVLNYDFVHNNLKE